MAKDKKSKKTIILIIIAVIVVVLLFPRRIPVKDGGSVYYESIGLGIIYSVKKVHQLPSTVDKDGYGYYVNVTVITIFGFTVYDDTHTDYDDLAIAPHNPEVESDPYS